MLDFKVQKIQSSVFLENFNLVDKVKIADELKGKSDNLFDGEPTILPLPANAPLEIPRIILQSRDGRFACNISIQRIDFFFQDAQASKKLEDIKDDYLNKTKNIFSYFIDDQKLTAGRIGFVVDFVSDTEKSSNELLQDNILQENSFFAKSKKIKNISLVFSERDKFNSWDINRLIKINSLRKISDPTNDKRLLLQYDINTIPEKLNEYILTTENIESILSKSCDEMMTLNLDKYIFSVK